MSDLEHRVFACIAWLPLPVAAPLRAAEVHEHEPAARLEHLAHAAEALMQFVGSVVVADGAAEGNALKLLAGTRSHAAMGIWRSAIEQITPGLKSATVPELRDLLKRKADSQRLLAALTTLSDARNALAHPIRRLTAELAAQHTPKLLAALDACLELLSFFSKFAMLRIDRVDDANGKLIVTPLVGAESLRKSVALRWPQPPPVGALVLVSAEPVSRWLELNPLYRLDADRRVLAYGRQHDTEVEHFDVCQPDRVDAQNVNVPNWLHWRLTDNPPRRGVSPLGAEGHRLANLGATAAFATSEPWPAAGDSDSARVALAIPPFPALPEPLNIKVAPFPGLPPPKPYALSKRQQLAVTLVSAVLGAGALVGVMWAMRAPSSTAESAVPEAPKSGSGVATPPAGDQPWKDPLLKRRHTDAPIKVANAADPTALLSQMTGAYDRKDLGGFESVYLDRLDCFYDQRPPHELGFASRHLFGKSKGLNYREQIAVRQIARLPSGDGTSDEVLLCEVTRDRPRKGTSERRAELHYYGARQTPDGWRIFAVAGLMDPMERGLPYRDSLCTAWLTDRFRGRQWYWPEPEEGVSLSNFGTTPCGEFPRP